MDHRFGAALNKARTGEPRLGPASRLFYRLLLGWFRGSGWTTVGALPAVPKFVIVGAPHTSNWDFLVFIGTVETLGRRVRFIGKTSLFRWPMGGLMRALGGVPVERNVRQDMVSQVVAQIAHHDRFALIVAAEGTRSPTTRWRTGFYQIALKAGIPIVCAGPNYPLKQGIIGPVITPTGDYDADMRPAFAFFRTLAPKFPERSAFPPETDPGRS